MDIFNVIKRPLITEKATELRMMENQYAFEVHQHSTKVDIRRAIEALFKVHVEKVATVAMTGKRRRVGRHIGRRPDWKKAIVTLKEGERIEVFE